jgi:hypothetical protein
MKFHPINEKSEEKISKQREGISLLIQISKLKDQDFAG